MAQRRPMAGQARHLPRPTPLLRHHHAHRRRRPPTRSKNAPAHQPAAHPEHLHPMAPTQRTASQRDQHSAPPRQPQQVNRPASRGFTPRSSSCQPIHPCRPWRTPALACHGPRNTSLSCTNVIRPSSLLVTPDHCLAGVSGGKRGTRNRRCCRVPCRPRPDLGDELVDAGGGVRAGGHFVVDIVKTYAAEYRGTSSTSRR